MTTTKETVRSLLERLPDNCSFEEIQYHLYVLTKVSQGLKSAETEGTISQAEVEKKLSKWLQ
ncbi:hypothetical protein [Spirulina sp. 06S082]|uniref:hypothetical protein n=1 Tax=Spirulina sp. 06S082 TaxID=3110248 RepID=UPI002B20F331|nr:hypothetical protein [Spirulina sp. 06S082]MEA5469064.1 hypothetical protein [Spirulina sp. 06S082]